MSKKGAGPPSGYTAPGQGAPGVFQAAGNADTQANRPNQSTDFASSGWTQDPKTGAWSQSTSANPQLQSSLFNLGQAGASATAKPISDGSTARTAAFDSIYKQGASRLDPQWQQAKDNFDVQMANQGMVPGTPAYDKAYANFQKAQTDAYSTLTNSATTEAGNAAQQQQQMDVTGQQAPFSIMNLIKSLTSMPGFNTNGGANMAAATGTSAYNLQDQQMQNTAWGDLLGGLFNLGGTVGGAAIKANPGLVGGAAPVAAAASDRRVKEDVEYLDREALPGVKLAKFRYVGDPRRFVGVIAQDVVAAGRGDLVSERAGVLHVAGALAPVELR